MSRQLAVAERHLATAAVDAETRRWTGRSGVHRLRVTRGPFPEPSKPSPAMAAAIVAAVAQAGGERSSTANTGTSQ